MVEKVHPKGPHNHDVKNHAPTVIAAAGKTHPTTGTEAEKKKAKGKGKSAVQAMYPSARHPEPDKDDAGYEAGA